MSKAAARVILNEIRIHLCPSSIESQGVRQFVTNGGYKKLKISNPSLPIMVRENEGVSAKVFARYGKLIYTLYTPAKRTLI